MTRKLKALSEKAKKKYKKQKGQKWTQVIFLRILITNIIMKIGDYLIFMVKTIKNP